MKHISKVISVFIGLSLTTCQRHSQSIEQYRQFEKKVEKRIFKKFPLNVDSLKSAHTVTVVSPSILERDYSGIFVTYQMENEIEFFQKLKEYSHIPSYRTHLNVSDENLLIVPDSLGNEFDKKKNPDIHPIPSLTSSLNFLSNIIDEQKSDFYVFDTNEGEYLKAPYDLPNKKYKSKGYSVGLISQDTTYLLTYWLLVW